uniref:Reverse transcriptase zinc-binding domain-containing protein n=1 Tax=Brassica oleracea var. oleracea TaxID=109376 RepID=A0A0D3E9J4_BRAOL
MRVSDLINQESKDWDVNLLEKYVNRVDIPLIRSLAISSTHRRDTFYWSYIRNGQYTVKLGYWVARNLLKTEEEKEVVEPSIIELQAFAWKLKAPKKICHLIWQLLTGHVAVTRNLARRNMKCDNYCPRCGEPEESVTDAIFECPPALQAWSLSSTPASPNLFPVSSVYTNMDYLFWRKNSIIDPEQDRDPYPWIIWYIWKARNNKLFRGIDRDPLELVRYAESECQAWFDANEVPQTVIHENNTEDPQVLSLGNICLLDGSWTPAAHFSGCGWVWMDNGGNIHLMGTRNITRRESALHLELEALRWAMENMSQHSTCQSFGTDCKDLIAMIKEPHVWTSFATELERIETLQICFPDFSIIHWLCASHSCSGVKSESTRNRIKSTWNRDSKIKMVGSVTEAHDSKVEALWWSYRITQRMIGEDGV